MFFHSRIVKKNVVNVSFFARKFENVYVVRDPYGGLRNCLWGRITLVLVSVGEE